MFDGGVAHAAFVYRTVDIEITQQRVAGEGWMEGRDELEHLVVVFGGGYAAHMETGGRRLGGCDLLTGEWRNGRGVRPDNCHSVFMDGWLGMPMAMHNYLQGSF